MPTPQSLNSNTRIMISAYIEAAMTIPKMFLSSFFGKKPDEIYVSDNENIVSDVERAGERISVDVVRGQDGRKNTQTIYSTTEYQPPLHDEATPITAAQLSKRLPGENGFNQVDRTLRQRSHILRAQLEQTKMILRAIEKQASGCLFNGVIELTNNDNIDFGRLGSHNITPSNDWNDQTNGDPIADLTLACINNKKDGKMMSNIAIFGTDAYQSFITHDKVKAYLDNRRIDPGLLSPRFDVGGSTFQGVIWVGDYKLDLYTYPEFYQVLATDALTEFVPTAQVSVFNGLAYLVKAFAATELIVQNEELFNQLGVAGVPTLVPGEIIPYAILDRKTLEAGVQSAPLLLPVAIDTISNINTQ